MKVKWYGHASFLLTSDQGTKIITDPYEPGAFGGAIAYGPIPDQADIVLVSHDHADHNYVQGLKGKPQIIKGTGSHKVNNLEFKGVAAYHDGRKGSERGQNTIFCFSLDGVSVCHLGDLGHVLSDPEAKQIGPVDLLFMPVGGVYTIDPNQASQTAQKLSPKIVIPMHYKTPHCGFALAKVEDFTSGKAGVKTVKGNEVEIKKEKLPQALEIIVLNPAM
jgi:L-ascorbate metabolism protein UlaG (beta-lactamase superfamily)